jgi:hypothetical protein
MNATGKDKIKRAYDKICSLLIDEYNNLKTYLKDLRTNPEKYKLTKKQVESLAAEMQLADHEVKLQEAALKKKGCWHLLEEDDLRPKSTFHPHDPITRTRSAPLLQIARGGRTRHKTLKKRRTRRRKRRRRKSRKRRCF